MELLGTYFGGAIAFPKGRGVWRDDSKGGKLIFDETIAIHCYTNMEIIDNRRLELPGFLIKMGKESNQGAVGFVIDRKYLEIRFAEHDKGETP